MNELLFWNILSTGGEATGGFFTHIDHFLSAKRGSPQVGSAPPGCADSEMLLGLTLLPAGALRPTGRTCQKQCVVGFPVL